MLLFAVPVAGALAVLRRIPAVLRLSGSGHLILMLVMLLAVVLGTVVGRSQGLAYGFALFASVAGCATVVTVVWQRSAGEGVFARVVSSPTWFPETPLDSRLNRVVRSICRV